MDGDSKLELMKFYQRVLQLAVSTDENQIWLSHVFTARHPDRSLDDLEKDFAALEEEYRAQIDDSLEDWSGDGALPPLAPVAEAWRRQRFAAASGLLAEAALADSTANQVLPERDMSESAAMKWLTMEWWYSTGRRRFAETALRYG